MRNPTGRLHPRCRWSRCRQHPGSRPRPPSEGSGCQRPETGAPNPSRRPCMREARPGGSPDIRRRVPAVVLDSFGVRLQGERVIGEDLRVSRRLTADACRQAVESPRPPNQDCRRQISPNVSVFGLRQGARFRCSRPSWNLGYEPPHHAQRRNGAGVDAAAEKRTWTNPARLTAEASRVRGAGTTGALPRSPTPIGGVSMLQLATIRIG